MVPAGGGQKAQIFLVPKAPKQNFGYQPQTFEGEEGGVEVRPGEGGVVPPPPTVYGRSNASLGGGVVPLLTQSETLSHWTKPTCHGVMAEAPPTPPPTRQKTHGTHKNMHKSKVYAEKDIHPHVVQGGGGGWIW